MYKEFLRLSLKNRERLNTAFDLDIRQRHKKIMLIFGHPETSYGLRAMYVRSYSHATLTMLAGSSKSIFIHNFNPQYS